MQPAIKIRCPKCGKEEFLDLSSLPRTLDASGLRNFSFIHEDHIFTIYVDTHGFVRGAYIKPLHYASDNNCFFNGYLVLTKVIVGHKFRFATVSNNRKIIDIRAFPELITNIHYFLNALLSDSLHTALVDYRIVKECSKDICIYGLEVNNNARKWLKLVSISFATEGIPTNTQLKKLLVYLDENKDREPTRGDLEYILKIIQEED